MLQKRIISLFADDSYDGKKRKLLKQISTKNKNLKKRYFQLVGGVAMFLMPKLTANQDPEVQKELQEMSDPSKLLSNLFGGGGASNSAPKKSAITAGSSGGGRSAAEKSSGSQSQHKGAQRRQR